MKKTLFLLMAAILSFTTLSAKVKVHTIGDSTMADYDESTTDKRGWCQYLQSFFDATQVEINNRGKSGADSRTFHNTAALWPSVKSQMASGDYLLIQFAHNDEGTVTYGTDNLELAAYNAANGLPALSDARGTCPYSTYRDMLRNYIDEARAMGVNPILVGPICRKYFSGNTIRRNGQHDLGDKFWKLDNGVLLKDQTLPATDHTMDYVEAMRIVAQEKNVPFLNLTEATKNLYVSLGEAACTSTLFCDGDNTHLQAAGAMEIGRLGAQMLKDSIPALAPHITIPTSLAAAPASIAIGETYSGITQEKEILLTGSGLEPAAGTVTVTASQNLLVSADKTSYGATTSIAYSGATLFQRVYIKATYTSAGEKNDSVVFTLGTERIVVPVNATVVSLEGGTAVSATWAITDKANPTNVVTVGPATAAMTMMNMMAADTKSDFSDNGSAITMVRLHNSDATGAKVAWPANEIDENTSRYVDFALTAPNNAEIRVTSISMKMAAYSTATMCLHVNTGVGDNMSGVTTISEKKNMTNQNVYTETFHPAITIPAGDVLHVRVLPWHENASASSGKYIALKDVVIEGMAFETTPVTKYTVTYNNGGHGSAVASTESLTLPNPLPTLVEEGWIFDGWFAEQTFNTAITAGGTLTQDTTLYAKWTERAKYAVTFEMNGHGTQIDPLNVYELPTTLPTPSEEGWRFDGWFTDAEFTTPAVKGAAVTAAMTLYAKWFELPVEPTGEVVATWDFRDGSAACASTNIQGTTGTVASDVAGIELTVDATCTNGKLQRNGAGYAQFNNGTIIRVPTISAQDEVTVVAYPNQHKYTIDGTAAADDSVTITAKGKGFCEIIATGGAYLYCIRVKQVKAPAQKEEKLLYFTNFQDWTDAASSTTAASKTVTTKATNEELTFTWAETQISATGTNAKFTNTEVVTPGYAMCAKTATPYFETSALASVSKVHFVQAATGGSRGWGLKVKGDGDADWVTIYDTYCTQAGSATDVVVNRTNCQLRFYNLNASQNGYLLELGIYGMVEPVERTFVDFKLDFRTNPYTVVMPSTGLPEGVVLTGTSNINGAQHGLNKGATVTVPVDGPVHFTIGGCGFNGGDVTVTDHTGAQIASIDARKTCENGVTDIATAPYASFATWNYNVEEPDTLTFSFANAYLPYFFAEACEYIANVKVTYFDQNGTRLGETEIAPGLPFNPAYTVTDLPAIPEGKTFRGWYTNVGEKAPAVINADVKLYALVTDIETPTVGSHYLYDLTKPTFYMEDHELISSTGSYKNTHGWGFNNGQNIKLVVSPKSYVIVGLCAYTNTSDQTITNKAGEVVGTMHVIRNGEEGAITDGATYAFFNESQNVDTLTFNFTTTSYIHTIEVFNVASEVEKSETGYYIIPAGDAASLMMVLKTVKKGEKIFLPNGTYDFGKVALTSLGVDSVSFIGESMDGVLVKNYPDEEGIGITATILLTGKNCYFQDLTLQCYAKATASAGRGVALQDKGTNNIFKNVFLQGTQDTYYSNGAQGMKAYFENGRIEGTVDFICGSGTVYFKNMQVGVVSRSSANVICAPNTKAGEQFGYIFDSCTVDAAADQVGKYNLCRPWNDSPAAVWLNTTLLQTGSAAGYTNMTDGLKLRFHEFGTVDANGAAVTGHNLTACKGSAESETLYLDAAGAAAYSYANVLGTWNPAQDAKQDTLAYADGAWSGATNAAAYLVNGTIVTTLPAEPAATDVVRAANARGGFGPAARINTNPTALEFTEVAIKAQKVIIKGQVYILRGNKRYTVTGVEVR